MVKESVEDLSQYVSRIIEEKQLCYEDVSRMSKGGITESYVRSITRGSADNPSVKKLQALALGLGISEEKIFRVARGLPAELSGEAEDMSSSSYHAILALMNECWKNRTLNEILQELAALPPKSLNRALRVIKVLNTRRTNSRRKRKNK